MARNPQRTTGGRNGGSVGRSHRGGTLRVLRPAKYDKSSSLTRVEPPRWFTARRKLVKFKSAFKTGLARCPAPPCSRYCQREIPPGLRQEFIALTFLGSFGWISLLNPFLPAAPQIVASFGLPRVVLSACVLSPRHGNSSNRPRDQIVTTIIGQDTRRNVADDVTVESDAFSSALKLFPPGISVEI